MVKSAKAETLFERAARTYRRYAEHLLSHTLPSGWGKPGCGWQQLWTSHHAGVYASCDGIILLDNLPDGVIPRKTVESVAERVFHGHLCPIFDDGTPTKTPDQRKNRNDATCNTLKLSKFLQAARTSLAGKRRPVPARLVVRARRQLEQARTHGGWPASVGVTHPKPSVFATGEALRALLPYGIAPRFVNEGVAFLAASFSKRNSVDTSGNEIVAMWAISSLLPRLKPMQARSAIDRLRFYLNQPYGHEPHRLTIHFNVDPSGRDDYFTYNASYLCAAATLNFVRATLMPVSSVSAVTDVIVHAIDTLEEFVTEWPATRSNAHLFWEQAQAAELLAAFATLTNQFVELKELTTMQVSPTHFHVQHFVVDDALGVILMPFKEKWSNGIHRAFRTAIEAESFRAWRSDNEFRDDNIMQTIWNQINKARFVVADCTGRNPNVFYEVGIAHTIGKPVFICAQKRADIPFDIGAIRSVTYGTTPSEVKALKSAIKKFIASL